uniref:aminopeptidase PepB n=1 Tax=Ningiella ruwaisensis TaxID=2364274 RepID=UPI00109FE150|nr:aminopeptidase PepB [Ningiella ruwaisensis]
MTAFTVKLSNTPAPSHVQATLPLSYNESGAIIHLNQDNNQIVDEQQESLALISKCARKLSTSFTGDAKLEGDWDLEQQWAFALGFGSPKSKGEVKWCNTADKTDLEQMYQALRFTRDLVNQTPEQMSPEALSSQVSDWISGLNNAAVSVRKWVGEELKQAGWQGIYEVGRGSERPPVLLEIDYNPGADEDATVDYALVGKGITFDSGGYSIKSSEGMLDMKCDMGGAATVAGAMGLAIMQGTKKRIKLFLCCAENLISGHAYKLGDIITYKNGTTVEIVNTDAEGRLVLADGLMAASESGAKVIIDAATLTGAAVMALGRDYNALFSLDKALQSRFLKVSESVNEPHWPLPLTKAHRFKCPSPFADTANSRPQKGGGAGGASNAAGFLSRFVNEDGKGWLHIDLAAAYNRDGTETMPSGGSGMGIRSIAALINEQA